MNPISSLLDYIKHHWFFLTVEQDVIDFLDNMVDVVPSEARNGLDLVLQGCGGVVFGELEHEIDLVFGLYAFVWFAEDVELVGSGFLDNLEFVKVDVADR
jgi:hypothetical protein